MYVVPFPDGHWADRAVDIAAADEEAVETMAAESVAELKVCLPGILLPVDGLAAATMEDEEITGVSTDVSTAESWPALSVPITALEYVLLK